MKAWKIHKTYSLDSTKNDWEKYFEANMVVFKKVEVKGLDKSVP